LSAAHIAVHDLVPNTYFQATVAIALGLFSREGLDVVHGLIFPNDKAFHWAVCVLPAQAPSTRDVV
jgi:hypothetical protein